jgi:hypothetical protein
VKFQIAARGHESEDKSMFRLVTALIIMLAMLVPVNAAPQSQEQDSNTLGRRTSDVVTRVAYRSTYFREGQHLRRACFALYRDGYYQLLRITQKGGKETLHGYLEQNELPSASMIKNLDFESSRGGTVLSNFEVFVADIAYGNKIVRHMWLNPDDHRPLPEPAVSIVNWLQTLKPQDASPFVPEESADQSVCPAGRWERIA